MTLSELALVFVIGVPSLGGTVYVAKLAGDTQWVPINAYQQEKLDDLQDDLFAYEQQEKWEGPLSQRNEEAKDRLEERIERLEQKLE